MIAVLDYGSGNIRSAQRACESTGHETVITSNPAIALSADGLVVPGVGAFAACINALRAIGGDQVIEERIRHNRPVLGICVGMQILFQSSEEDQYQSRGLGFFNGRIKKLAHPVLPQVGWNIVEAPSDSQLFRSLSKESFYFVHSYAAIDDEPDAKVTYAEHGSRFIAAIERGAVSAVQFHPEKSGRAGLQLISQWAEKL